MVVSHRAQYTRVERTAFLFHFQIRKGRESCLTSPPTRFLEATSSSTLQQITKKKTPYTQFIFQSSKGKDWELGRKGSISPSFPSLKEKGPLKSALDVWISPQTWNWRGVGWVGGKGATTMTHCAQRRSEMHIPKSSAGFLSSPFLLQFPIFASTSFSVSLPLLLRRAL